MTTKDDRRRPTTADDGDGDDDDDGEGDDDDDRDVTIGLDWTGLERRPSWDLSLPSKTAARHAWSTPH